MVRTELQTLHDRSAFPSRFRMYGATYEEVEASAGDIVVVDATAHNIVIWLPPASDQTRGNMILCCKSGGSNVTFLTPRSGTINGSNTYMTSPTANTVNLVLCVNGQNSGWIVK